jgi:cytochrome b
MAETGTVHSEVRLWDWPVRIIHWSFVILLAAMWWTGEEGDLTLHKQLGMAFLGLLAFRLLWGFVGSSTARFGQFLKGPAAVFAFLKGSDGRAPIIGHNPIGGWSVIAMLALLGLQIGLGLIAQDVDGLESGPLNHLVSYDTAEAAREWHHLLFNIILGIVALHVAAILYYLVVRRDNLVKPMITGRKDMDGVVEQPRSGSVLALILCAVLAFGFMWWIWAGAPPSGG